VKNPDQFRNPSTFFIIAENKLTASSTKQQSYDAPVDGDK